MLRRCISSLARCETQVTRSLLGFRAYSELSCYSPKPSPILCGLGKHRPAILSKSSRLWRLTSTRHITISSILLPPVVFTGLLLTLWVYKSLMLVLFQNKIIYMPSVPPFSRSERIEDYAAACAPVVWRQEMIRSTDGTRIALAIGENETMQSWGKSTRGAKNMRALVLLYFQGNAASLPPRLPGLSNVLRRLDRSSSPVACTLVALSYRGFWTSSGRASQLGIEKDAAAALAFTQSLRKELDVDSMSVLWGQSIGAGVATTAAAGALARSAGDEKTEVRMRKVDGKVIDALILETPFTSVRNMLVALYPQKWLPYRYLWPFLWNHWDSEKALSSIDVEKRRTMPLLVVTAGGDEVVPAEEGQRLMRFCRELDFDVEHKEIPNALHTEVLTKPEGRRTIVRFLEKVHFRNGS